MLPAEPEGLLAARLIERAEAAGPAGLVLLARSEGRADRLARAAQALRPAALEVLWLPGWDCLPYDRVSPSATVMGRRLAVAARLAANPAPETPRLLILSAETAMQRLPRPDPGAGLRLAEGEALELEALRHRIATLGYRIDELVDEPGEAALRGGLLDIFPAWAPEEAGLRIRHAEGRIASIHRYEPASQRSLGEPLPEVTIAPASELLLPEDHPLAAERPPGLEHLLPAFGQALVAPLELMPQAEIARDAGAEEARQRRLADVAEAFRLRISSAAPQRGLPPLPPPEAFYLDEAAWARQLAGRRLLTVEAPAEASPQPPRFAAGAEPEAAFTRFAEELLARGGRLAIAGGQGRGARRLAARLAGRRDEAVLRPDGWPGLLRAPAGSIALFKAAPGPDGFATPDAAIVPFATIRPGSDAAPETKVAAVLTLGPPVLQPGDAVIHIEHGLGALRGVEPVEIGDARMDCLRLDYADDTSRLVPFDELDRLWRYGATAENVSLDRLEGGGWAKRRAEAERAAVETARQLVAMMRQREAARAPALVPPEAEMRRIAAGFPFEPTTDQATAIAATLGDLASGRPMDRLVCGDVGFGKTEVALRATAAAALAGRQVALIAPTTVLVRQHLETFRRRFAPLGLRVEGLSRLTSAAEARKIRAGLATGEVAVAIGTTALAAKSVRFRDLGLLIIDEEQRFGVREKAALSRLRGQDAKTGLHLLTLTATPIPRTLQGAMVGLRELSVIATPPARRQPVRTLRGTVEDGVLAQALRREAKRGGQSFLVCPRIEDIAPMRERLAAIAPELEVIVAHGGLPPAEMDEAMVRFAGGEGDVLLATAIVEAGLDVPRANTMLVCGAERFGLSQLHQLRGRVGRGRLRGVVWLLTAPGRKLPAPTERRLRALVAMDRLGAGFAISARDLDLRGAGDLLGEAQAGHLRLVGMELHQHLLRRALALARGETPPEEWSPSLALGVEAHVPPEHVPEVALRVELHARLGALLREGDAGALEALEEEAEDRFGPAPPPLRNLFALAGLSLRCRRLGVARLEAGPQAVAATLRGKPPRSAPSPLMLKGDRLLLRRPCPDGAARLAAAEALLDALEAQERAAA